MQCRGSNPAVVTDGLNCFRGVRLQAWGDDDRIWTQGRALPTFKWVNTIFGNIKRSIAGTFRGMIRKKQMVRYLAEFKWRFNHRFDLAGMIPALAGAAAQSKPVTFGQLKWPDFGAQSGWSLPI